MKKKAGATLLQTAIPVDRGPADHFERTDGSAFTVFDRKGQVEAIHTPQDSLRRVHEVLHARHSRTKEYPKIIEEVAEIIEDCRIHLKHWPWERGHTPQEIVLDATGTLLQEVAESRDVTRPDAFGQFATALRAAAVLHGIGSALPGELFKTERQRILAEQYLSLIATNQHYLVAKRMEKTFFSDEDEEVIKKKKRKASRGDDGSEEELGEAYGDEATEGRARSAKGDDSDLRMKTIELPLTESTVDPSIGFRLAVSGARIHRPALRRPVLPHRLFIKRAPVDSVGAVLFDASGSMGVNPQMLNDCCERAPTAAVAFYAGIDGPRTGMMWIYAKDGMRYAGPPVGFPGGNGVDDLALDWLMKQEGPRIFVTDYGFSCPDASGEVVRLENLEELGEVTVYKSYHAFKKAYPKTAKEAA